MLSYFDILPKDPQFFAEASNFTPWLKYVREFSSGPFASFNILRRVFIPPKSDDWDVDGEVITVQSKVSMWKDSCGDQGEYIRAYSQTYVVGWSGMVEMKKLTLYRKSYCSSIPRSETRIP